MGVLYPHRGTTKRKGDLRDKERHTDGLDCLNTWTAQVYQPINSLCGYTVGVEFSPLYCISILSTDDAHVIKSQG